MPPSQNPCYGSTNRAAHVYSTPLIRSSSIEATEDCLRSSPPALPSSFEIILQRKELQTFSYPSQIFRETSPKSISYTLSLYPRWITCISLFFRLERSRSWLLHYGPTKTEKRRKDRTKDTILFEPRRTRNRSEKIVRIKISILFTRDIRPDSRTVDV